MSGILHKCDSCGHNTSNADYICDKCDAEIAIVIAPTYTDFWANSGANKINFIFSNYCTGKINLSDAKFLDIWGPIMEDDFANHTTSEHLFQAAKYIYPGASDSHVKYGKTILSMTTANRAKALGSNSNPAYSDKQKAQILNIKKTRPSHIRPNWDNLRDKIMFVILCVKFGDKNPHLQKRLIDTGDSIIREVSPYDNYWGTGKDMKGLNKLGKLLMKVRNKIRQ